MQLLRIAGATLNQTPLDFPGNRDRILAVLAAARGQGVDLLCLPELTLTGYGCEDAFFSLDTAKQAETALGEILPATIGMTVVIGLPHFHDGAMYNCAAMLQNGRVLGLNAKRVLPREGVHYEPRWFRPWPFGKVASTNLCGSTVPLGDFHYRLGGVGVALEICEEAWDAVPAAAAHASAVDLILNPSASHFALGKYARREHLVANSSRAMQVIYLYTNLVGLEAGRIIYDGGVLIAAGGDITCRGSRFGFADYGLVCHDVNPELARIAKLKAKPVRDIASEATGEAVAVLGDDPRGRQPKPVLAVGEVEVPRLANVEFLHAEMLGLFDYLRKSAARGYVVSLSGGCDSACCAVLVAHMVAAARSELGADGLARRLALPEAWVSGDARSLIRHLLTTVYQSTTNSGPVTKAAAAAVAAATGAEFQVFDVQPMVDAYVLGVEAVLGRRLTWATDDLTLQNVQARVRAPLVWTIANAKNAILLTTSNRSEAAVGYATMDGDTAGGLAPLAGIDKHFLRQWLAWAAVDCELGLGALPALQAVVVQAPTAELRPPGAAQRDEDDLMPYAILDRIERYFIRDRLGPRDVLAMLRRDFPAVPAPEMVEHLRRFYHLWARNQWKRERFAPSFHLDEESLDPKTWCRYPILSRPYGVEASWLKEGG